MPSSDSNEPLREIAARLSPAPVRGLEPVRRGGNSRIYRLITTAGDFALKCYPDDPRDRQGAEARALAFFERAAIPHTPRLVTLDLQSRTSLMTWLDGQPLEAVSDRDVERFAAFQIALHRSIDSKARADIGEASEACLSGLRILRQINDRFARLEAVKHQVPQFADFFDATLRPALTRLEANARQRYARLAIDFDADLPTAEQTLIASDFGAHNALRTPDGSLAFLDFEYFGWDDPLTSIGNFVFHPGMTLTERQRNLYDATVLGALGTAAQRRRDALMPLYALRFAAIVLGDLLPERWRHRLAAGGATQQDWDMARTRQIEKAKRLLRQAEAARPD